MKAILISQAEITSIAARVDRSIRFSVVTGELGDEERASFFPLQGTNVKLLIEPHESDAEAPVEVRSELKQKTPGQRLRGSIFILYTQNGSPGDFEQFYKAKMEQFIDSIKSKLDPP